MRCDHSLTFLIKDLTIFYILYILIQPQNTVTVELNPQSALYHPVNNVFSVYGSPGSLAVYVLWQHMYKE